MRLVAGDIGGTKTILRCVEAGGQVSLEGRYDSSSYPTFDDMLVEFLSRAPGPVDTACFAVAGPVHGHEAEVTNLGWQIAARALERTFAISRVALINDFYAVALGVPQLSSRDLLSLQQGVRDRSAPIAILGAGTGLGEAILVQGPSGPAVVASEGGHKDFAPQDALQTELFLHLHARYGHVSWERVVSGMGLVNIFTFLGGPEITPAEIAMQAGEGDARAVQTFEIFVDAYGSEAGNMALSVLARGGVFLAGGIAAKNTRWFSDGRFVEAFRRKGRFRELMDTIPVDLVLNEEVGLLGAVEGARRAGAEP